MGVRGDIRVDVFESHLELHLRKGENVLWAACRQTPDRETYESCVQELLESCPAGSGSLVQTRFHEPVSQVRTLRNLPPVRGRELQGLVLGQRYRFFRRRGGHLCVGAVWEDRTGEVPRARAAAVEEWRVAAVADAVHDRGMRLGSLAPAGFDGLSLLTPGLRKVETRRSLRALSWWMAAALLPWISALVVYSGGLVWDRYRLRTELDAIAQPLEILQGIKGKVARVTPVAEAVSERTQRWVLPTLGLLTQSLPEAAYVIAVDLRRAEPGYVLIRTSDPDLVIGSLARSLSDVVEVERVAVGQEGWVDITLQIGQVAG